MNETETLTKKEYEFLSTIDKQNSLIEKLKSALENEKKKCEISSNEKNNLLSDHAVLKTEAESLKAKVSDAKKEAQINCEEAEKVNAEQAKTIQSLKQEIENKEKMISDFKLNILPEKELLFYKACKADVVLDVLFKNKKFSLSIEELKKNEFPIDLLANDETGIATANFMLEKVNGNNSYELTRV